MSPDAGIYVYGIVRSGALAEAPSVDGVGGGEVRVVEQSPLAAVVGTLPAGELRVRRRDLRAHLDVLEEAFAHATIVPCRFGMVLESADAVRADLLAARRDVLLDLLERLEGRVQLTLTALHDEETVLRGVVTAEPEIARLRERTRRAGDEGYFANVRLGELVAAAVEDRRRADADLILDQLEPVVEAVAADEAGSGRVLKASLLVRRDGVRDVERRLEALGEEAGGRLRFELIGPLPPTAFAELVDEEAAAWA